MCVYTRVYNNYNMDLKEILYNRELLYNIIVIVQCKQFIQEYNIIIIMLKLGFVFKRITICMHAIYCTSF